MERLLVKTPAAHLCLRSSFKISYQMADDELLQDPRRISSLEHQDIQRRVGLAFILAGNPLSLQI